jgi:hypothetical protein
MWETRRASEWLIRARPALVIRTVVCALALPASAAINVGNRVWSDSNGDGIQDSGEPGLAGVGVQLWNSTKTSLLDSDTTDSSGAYLLVAPSPGTYRVRVILPANTLGFSPRDEGGSDTADSDIHPDGVDAGFTDVLNFPSNLVSITSIDAGIVPDPMGSDNLGDRVFRANASGTQTGASGLGGVTVQLLSLSGTVLQTTVSNSGGYYSFTAAPGGHRLRFVAPPGYLPSPLPNAGGDDSNDSDIDADGYTASFTVPVSGKLRTMDGGFVIATSVGNFVWSDRDQDGVQDAGEPGIEGVIVQIWNAALTQMIDSTVTDAQGRYAVVVPAGASYRVRVVKKYPGDAFTVKDAAADDLTDSDINPSGPYAGFTDSFSIATNVISTVTRDIGIIEDPMRNHTIGDTVFRADAGGLQGGSTVSGVPVDLLDASGAVLQSTVSGSGGFYSFLAPPGNYRLRFGTPPGMLPTPHRDAGLDDTLDSDIDANGMTALFTLGAGQVRRDLDAGFVYWVSIGNLCWHDLDEDGIQDAGESGVPGVEVELWTADKSARLDATTTNGSGFYTLQAPGAGDYRVWVLRPSPLDAFSPKDAGGDNLKDSDVNPTGGDFGFTDAFNIASNVISTVTYDIGLRYSGPTARDLPEPRVTAFRTDGTQWWIDYQLPIFGSYQVESSTDLDQWTPEGPAFSVVLSSGTRTMPRSAAIPRKFFRIRRTR